MKLLEEFLNILSKKCLLLICLILMKILNLKVSFHIDTFVVILCIRRVM